MDHRHHGYHKGAGRDEVLKSLGLCLTDVIS